MMSNPLQALNKYRKKPAKPKRKRTEKKEKCVPGSVPVQDLALDSVHDPYEQMKEFQKIKDDDNEVGAVLPILTKKFVKNRLKDYRAGPVKIYTRAEIAEYERNRDD